MQPIEGTTAQKRRSPLAMLANAARRLPQSPSSAAEAARRKTIGSHADVNLPAAAGGGFRWGGQIMHSPGEAYAYARSHGSGLNEQQFFNRYNELGAMQHPQAEQGLGAAAEPQPQPMIQPGGPMHGITVDPEMLAGTLRHLAGRSAAKGRSRDVAVKQALLAAHVIQRLRRAAAMMGDMGMGGVVDETTPGVGGVGGLYGDTLVQPMPAPRR